MVLESAVQSTRNDSIYLETIVKMLFFFQKAFKKFGVGGPDALLSKYAGILCQQHH